MFKTFVSLLSGQALYNYHTSFPVIYVLVIFADGKGMDIPVFWDKTQ